MPEPLLRVRGLKVHFPIKSGVVFDRQVGAVKAVDGVDLDVHQGQTVGLVGESGCGKSTFGRAVLRLTEVTEGEIVFQGVDLATLEGEELRRKRRSMQMVFQDPMASLNPRQNVETLLTEPLRAHGIAYEKAGSESCWIWLACRPQRPPDIPTSSAVVSVNASALPELSPWSRSSSSRTSRCQRSTYRSKPR